MQTSLRIAYRNMESSPSLDERLQDEATKLERFHPRITACHVTVEAPHQHKCGIFAVKLNVFVPGGEIIVTHHGPRNPAHEDVYVAVRDAFAAARRRLEDVSNKMRGQVKQHGESRV